MYVSDLALWDFRSYSEAVVALEPGVTAFVGPNGQGKTNLVEAIGYLATLASHRVGTDAALIRAGAQRAMIQAKIMRDNRPTIVDLEIIAGQAKRARINRSPVNRVREILGQVAVVIFAPEDLALVKGDPEGRRRFLDELASQLAPRHAAILSDYQRIIRQRNALLKSSGGALRSGKSPDLRTLDVWDHKAASTGAALLHSRVDVVQKLQDRVQTLYREISGGQGQATINYQSSLTDTAGDGLAMTELNDVGVTAARLMEAMAHLRERELQRGVSLVGPHRDDLQLNLRDMPARMYASHGESWSFALALRLASYQVLSADSLAADGEPVLILDDVFAELDTRRRQFLTDVVNHAEQVLITAAVAEDLPENLPGARWDVFESELKRVR